MNSIIFLIWFLIFYAIALIVCSIVKHSLIKSLRDKKLNKLKMKRARSINPRAEKMASREEWRSLKLKYKESRKFHHKLASFFTGAIVSLIVGYITLIPFGYAAKDSKKEYLIKGYEYTLNGVVGEKLPKFLIHAEEILNDDGIEDTPSTPEEEANNA